jgi:hypothetical protein
MKNKTKIIVISSASIAILTAAYLIIRGIRVNKYYNALMNILNTGQNITGTIADAKETDLAWDPNYWARLVDSGTMALTDFNYSQGLKNASDLYNLSDDNAVSILTGIKNKAQFSYLSYYYLQASGKNQTLLQKVQDMSDENSQKIYKWTLTIPDL